MNATKRITFPGGDRGKLLTVDIEGLKALLSCGKQTAREIGEKAGASFLVGRRRLYSVPRVQAYIDSLAEIEAGRADATSV